MWDLTNLWSQQKGDFFCVSTKSKSGTWTDHFLKRKDIGRLKDFIKGHKDHDIYFCPHGFMKRRRLEECAAESTWLWADLDEADPRKMKGLKPTVAFESSKGRYVGLWKCDRVIDKLLNKRMTYHVGADKGGWDITQVLRVPTTKNHKYKPAPKVKVLWTDGPEYKVKELKRVLGKLEEIEDIELTDSTAYERNEDLIPVRVRRDLMADRCRGDRSEKCWSIMNSLAEAGVSSEDIKQLIGGSVWGEKYEGRGKLLEREVKKAIRGHTRSGKKKKGERGFAIGGMADVKMEKLEWLIEGFLLKHDLNSIVGDGGAGKSQLILDFIFRMIEKSDINDLKVEGIRNALLIGNEDNLSTVVKARMMAAGYTGKHLGRVFTLTGQELDKKGNPEDNFLLDNDEMVEKLIETIQHNKIDLVVFDPIMDFLGEGDAHNHSEVSALLAKLAGICHAHKVTILMVRHTRKAKDGGIRDAGTGSKAFTTKVRNQLHVALLREDLKPEEGTWGAIMPTKANYFKQLDALSYEIVGSFVSEGGVSNDTSFTRMGDSIKLTEEDMRSGEISSVSKTLAERILEEKCEKWTSQADLIKWAEELSIAGRDKVKRELKDLVTQRKLDRKTKGKKIFFIKRHARKKETG